MKTQPTLDQKRVHDDMLWIEAKDPEATSDECRFFANVCALDRIAQAINRFADVVEKATAKGESDAQSTKN